jgi:phospholipid-translocating P-type ATPase (flippase)
MRVLDEKEYQDWNDKFKEASMDLKNKKERTDDLMNDIEQEVYLMGATIVEDKLQHQVPETIKDLRMAAIKVWMLTGDKMNTAYNIGLSCNLINHNIQSFFVNGESGDTLDKLVEEYTAFKGDINTTAFNTAKPHSVIIDSVALTRILEKRSNIKKFLDITYNAVSVICCRVSPLQKSEVVKIMKEYDPNAVTLSIGDGGNDVSMIMEAHIGIGVYGEEGMRAVQASDFAIGEFKMLRKLLLFHGRTNYIRITEMILYFFFKNFVFTIIHFFYAWYSTCSGQTIIDDWFISLFNIIFTAVPLMFKAFLDQDLIIEDGEVVYFLMPFLYKETRDKSNYNTFAFIGVFTRGISQALFNFFMAITIFGGSSIDVNGNTADLWFLSVNLFTSIIFVRYFYDSDCKFQTTSRSKVPHLVEHSLYGNHFLDFVCYFHYFCEREQHFQLDSHDGSCFQFAEFLSNCDYSLWCLLPI